jgi:GTP-binding protein
MGAEAAAAMCYTPPVNITSAVFVKSVGSVADLPRGRFPEIAVCGRSNVGKSSLINCLLRRHGLARVSGVPGRTQLLNFFLVNDEFFLVDLPGYGYARVPERVSRTWGPLVEGYLGGDRDLRTVLLVLDARREVTEHDRRMKQFLNHLSLDCLPILTKIDKIPRAARREQRRRAAAALGLEEPLQLIPFSARSGEGRDEVLVTIGRSLRGA